MVDAKPEMVWYGYGIHTPASHLQYPELYEHLVAMVHGIMRDRYPIGDAEIVIRTEQPYRFEPTGEIVEDEDGEKFPDVERVGCPAEEATHLFMFFEAPGPPQEVI